MHYNHHRISTVPDSSDVYAKGNLDFDSLEFGQKVANDNYKEDNKSILNNLFTLNEFIELQDFQVIIFLNFQN